MIVAVAVYGAVVLVLATVLRPQYLPPETVQVVLDPATGRVIDAADGWQVGQRDLGDGGYDASYQPDGRYWSFQLIETAILAALSAVALVLSRPRVIERRERKPAAAR